MAGDADARLTRASPIHRIQVRPRTGQRPQCLPCHRPHIKTEIADLLDLSAATISQHLFGKRGHGKCIGGAIPKLRKKLTALGLPDAIASS